MRNQTAAVLIVLPLSIACGGGGGGGGSSPTSPAPGVEVIGMWNNGTLRITAVDGTGCLSTWARELRGVDQPASGEVRPLNEQYALDVFLDSLSSLSLWTVVEGTIDASGTVSMVLGFGGGRLQVCEGSFFTSSAFTVSFEGVASSSKIEGTLVETGSAHETDGNGNQIMGGEFPMDYTITAKLTLTR